jgi:hypothetical protein
MTALSRFIRRNSTPPPLRTRQPSMVSTGFDDVTLGYTHTRASTPENVSSISPTLLQEFGMASDSTFEIQATQVTQAAETALTSRKRKSRSMFAYSLTR